MHEHHHAHGGCQHHKASHHALIVSIAIIFIFSIIEVISGHLAHSLALLSDAGHMASDALSLILAAFAGWIAIKPPSHKHSYGLGRAEIVAAWLSSVIMLILSIAIIVEAIHRFETHAPVHSMTLIIIGGLGFITNCFVAWLLSRGQQTLNIRAALLHVIGDLLGSIAALIAGAVILYTKWYPIDPILSIFISILIMVSSIRLLRESLQVLMEGVPPNIDIEMMSAHLESIEGVNAVHDLHVWTLSSGILVLSAHVNIKEFSGWPHLLEILRQTIKKRYGIDHITLQPEPELIDCQSCDQK